MDDVDRTDENRAAHPLIAAERRRQIEQEGWTPEHDDQHADGDLYDAAMCYLRASRLDQSCAQPVPDLWPWTRQWWKPKDRLSNLVRAGALFLAEQERTNRRETGPRQCRNEISFLLDGIALEIERVKGPLSVPAAPYALTDNAGLVWQAGYRAALNLILGA